MRLLAWLAASVLLAGCVASSGPTTQPSLITPMTVQADAELATDLGLKLGKVPPGTAVKAYVLITAQVQGSATGISPALVAQLVSALPPGDAPIVAALVKSVQARAAALAPQGSTASQLGPYLQAGLLGIQSGLATYITSNGLTLPTGN